jgi:hypothetical protein
MSLLVRDVHLAGDTNGGFARFLAVLPTADHQTPFDFAKLWAKEAGVLRRPKVEEKEEFHAPDTRHAQVISWELRDHQGVTGKGGIASAAEPSPSMPTAERCQERIIAKGKWSCAHFPKRSRQLVVASRDPPLGGTCCITSPTSFCHFLLAGGMRQTHDSQKRISCKKTHIPVPSSESAVV